MELRVVDDPDQSRYEIRADGELAGFLTYRLRDGELALLHTETDTRLRGQGVAGRLVQFALDSARERHLAVLPYCPFVRTWLAEHPEYTNLIPKDRRPHFGL
jgi:predicted GNAT family acetyltransferase